MTFQWLIWTNFVVLSRDAYSRLFRLDTSFQNAFICYFGFQKTTLAILYGVIWPPRHYKSLLSDSVSFCFIFYFFLKNCIHVFFLWMQNPKLLVLGNTTQMKSSSKQNIYHSQHSHQENSSSRSSSTAAPSPCFPIINNNNPTHNNYNNNNNNVENNPPSQRTDLNGIRLPLTPSGEFPEIVTDNIERGWLAGLVGGGFRRAKFSRRSWTSDWLLFVFNYFR